MFSKNDFQDSDGNPASPETAALIANRVFSEFFQAALMGPASKEISFACHDIDCDDCFDLAKKIVIRFKTRPMSSLEPKERQDFSWAISKVIQRIGSRGLIEFMKQERDRENEKIDC